VILSVELEVLERGDRSARGVLLKDINGVLRPAQCRRIVPDLVLVVEENRPKAVRYSERTQPCL
jgi:hypothetical protein